MTNFSIPTMSLTTTLRNVVMGLWMACTPSPNDTSPAIPEECDTLSQTEFDQAFGSARREMEGQGREVRSAILNNPQQFTELANLVMYYTGCVSSRRQGPGECATISYCGPGTDESCPRFFPGNCLDGMCYTHDRCYDNILEEEKQLCLWSDQTRGCDMAFFEGYDTCNENNECGFYCRLVGTIALGLAVIEQKYADFGPGCLWDGDYGRPRIGDQPKDPPKDDKYKEPDDKKDPKKEKIDWELRRLCGDFIDRMIRCDVDYLPPALKQLLDGELCVSDNKTLERNRNLFECNYETTCGRFVRSVRR